MPQADNINCHQFDGVHSVARSSLLANRYRWPEVRTMCERFCRAASRYLTDGALPMPHPLPTPRVALTLTKDCPRVEPHGYIRMLSCCVS